MYRKYVVEAYVEDYHILIISLHISDFSSKSNGPIYYLKDCTVIFIESLSVFRNISKEPGTLFSYFRHF